MRRQKKVRNIKYKDIYNLLIILTVYSVIKYTMISPKDMEYTCSRDERCIYASFELPIGLTNNGDHIYNTCKFRHKCTLWKIMSLYNYKFYINYMTN